MTFKLKIGDRVRCKNWPKGMSANVIWWPKRWIASVAIDHDGHRAHECWVFASDLELLPPDPPDVLSLDYMKRDADKRSLPNYPACVFECDGEYEWDYDDPRTREIYARDGFTPLYTQPRAGGEWTAVGHRWTDEEIRQLEGEERPALTLNQIRSIEIEMRQLNQPAIISPAPNAKTIFDIKQNKITFPSPTADWGLISNTSFPLPESPLVAPPKQRACVPYTAEELRALRKTVHAPYPLATFQTPLLAWHGKA